jgi:hypothetical protein
MLPAELDAAVSGLDRLRGLVHARRLLDDPYNSSMAFTISFGYNILRAERSDIPLMSAALKSYYESRIAQENASLVTAGVDTSTVLNRPPTLISMSPTCGSFVLAPDADGGNVLWAFGGRSGVIATVSAVDPDADVVTFLLVQDSSGRFFNVGSSLYGSPPAYPAIDYHTFTGQQITVRGTDSFGLTLDLQFKVYGMVLPLDVLFASTSIYTQTFQATNARAHVVDTNAATTAVEIEPPTLSVGEAGVFYVIDRNASNQSRSLMMKQYGSSLGPLLSIRDGADISAAAGRIVVYKIALVASAGVSTWMVSALRIVDKFSGFSIPAVHSSAYPLS